MIDTDEQTVSRDQRRVRLRPLPFTLMVYLIANRHRVVPKHEIVDQIWEGRAISDGAVASAIRDIRKAIGESGSGHKWIRTFYGRGLRWVDRDEGWSQTAAASLTEPRSLFPRLVLTGIQDATLDGSAEDIALGFTADLNVELSKALYISAAPALINEGASALGIGQRSGARYVLDGSVRLVSGSLRVTVQLLDAIKGTSIWAERFDQSSKDLAATQDAITAAIAVAVPFQVALNERRRAALKPLEDLDAWENAQLGFKHLFEHDYTAMDHAISCFRRAIVLESGFSDAYGGLARALLVKATYFPTNRSALLVEAETQARKAIQIEPLRPGGWLALTRYFQVVGKSEEAIAASDKAIELSDELYKPYFFKGLSLLLAGRAEEALAHIDRSLRIDPVHPYQWAMHASRAFALTMLDRHEEALAAARTGHRNSNLDIHSLIAELCALGWLDRQEEAERRIGELERALQVRGVPGSAWGAIMRMPPITDRKALAKVLSGFRRARIHAMLRDAT
ncbi:MAG: winged helix-turn-helix domain-containing protein [Pseudomonadota bacterium]